MGRGINIIERCFTWIINFLKGTYREKPFTIGIWLLKSV